MAFVSLAALRWLADQNASFFMLERDGAVLATTGPVRPSDARLRRAQSLSWGSIRRGSGDRQGVNERKLAGQKRLTLQCFWGFCSGKKDCVGSCGTKRSARKKVEEIRYF